MLQENFTIFPTLTTKRLTLRRLTTEDSKQIYILRSDEKLNKYIIRQKINTVNEAIEFINMIDVGVNLNQWYYWALSLKSDNTLIGTICLWNINIEGSCVEIGYELLPRFHGKGFMNEALSAVILFGSSELKFSTIVAYTNASNIKSTNILEKNNFKRDMTLENNFSYKEGLVNTIIYSLQAPV